MKKILFFISWDEIIIWQLFSYKINLKEKKKPKKQQQIKKNPQNQLRTMVEISYQSTQSPTIGGQFLHSFFWGRQNLTIKSSCLYRTRHRLLSSANTSPEIFQNQTLATEVKHPRDDTRFLKEPHHSPPWCQSHSLWRFRSVKKFRFPFLPTTSNFASASEL